MAVLDGMPDDILHAFLEYLPFEDQLRVLAVSTRCRAVGMEHPFYWKRLYMDLDEFSESKLQGAIDNLSKRLAYAEGRHVEVSLNWSDPRRVMDLILSHISHIVLLEFVGVDILIGHHLLDALNQSAAPILRELKLLFNGNPKGVPLPDVDQRPCLDSGLFRSSAPSLRHLELANVDFPAEFPKALGALTWLSSCVTRGLTQEIPFVLKHCDHLDVLMLSGRFVLCPEFYDAQAHDWQRMRLLSVMSNIIPRNELFPWHAWTHIPSLVAFFVGVDVATAVLDHLSGPLRLVADIRIGEAGSESFRLSATTDDHDSDDLRASTAGAHFWRTILGPIPQPGNARDLQYAGGLLAVAARAAHFMRLTLPLAHWNRLAAHVPAWPALRGLRLLLPAGVVRCPSDPAPVECPALVHVRLAKQYPEYRTYIRFNEFAAFAAVAIRGATLPMGLGCEMGVERTPVPRSETFNRVFCPWRKRSVQG